MKKQLIYLVTVLASSMFLLSSCDKDNDNTTPKTKTQLISQGSWKFSSATINGSDASGMVQACQKDNILVFAAAGTGNASEGPTKCNSGDPDNIPFTWNFANNETTLHISATLFTNGSNDAVLELVSETQLIITVTITPTVGPSYNIRITFTH